MNFLCHWQYKYWTPEFNPEYRPLRAAGANHFYERGAEDDCGHRVYIVSIADGYLYLGGRMCISRVVSRDEAIRVTGNNNLYTGADEWVIDETPTRGTLLDLHRRLDPAVTRRIQRFMADDLPRGLRFKPNNQTATRLDPQATRNIPRLTEPSAALLDQIIAITDDRLRTGEVLTFTEEMLARGSVAAIGRQ